MLVQWTKRDVPDLGVWTRRLIVRHPTFVVCVLRSSGIAHDWQAQSGAIAYPARGARTQLSLLLDGRGYFWLQDGPRALSPGDIVESDQRRLEYEGYGGSPLRVVSVEYDDDGLFGRARPGEARFSRIARSDLAALRSIVDRSEELQPAQLVRELALVLGGIGQPVERDYDLSTRPRLDVARVFGAMGDAISRMDRQPSLSELADAIELTERQTNRHFKELMRAYAHPNESWREFISDARIGAATQMLSLPGVPLGQVAKLSGYGSAIALCHAFALKNAPTPGELARRLAERWR